MVHNQVVQLSPIPSPTPQSIAFTYNSQAKKFSTSNYMPIQTQNRASLEEIEQFLEKANAPIREWYTEYGYLQEGSFKMTVLIIICTILSPLMFIYICWITAAQNKSAKKFKEASEKAKIIIRDNSQPFIEKELLWNIPTNFPHWIELWTSIEEPPQAGTLKKLSKHPKQNGYLINQNMQQNHYDGNTFRSGASV